MTPRDWYTLPADDDPAADTQPLWTPGTPFADEHLRTLIEIGLVTPDVDTENEDVDA